MSDEWTRHVSDPDGRDVVFDAGSLLHLTHRRARFLEHVDHRTDDPEPGRERFYRRDFPTQGQWLRVVVGFQDEPAWVVTAFHQENDPRLELR